MEFDKTAYALILTRPRLGMLGISLLQSVVELWAFTCVRILFNVFPQYFETKSMEFDNNLHMHG